MFSRAAPSSSTPVKLELLGMALYINIIIFSMVLRYSYMTVFLAILATILGAIINEYTRRNGRT